MGRFIVSRSAAGDRFLLQSDSGRTLALSRDFATLDACKKSIKALVRDLPRAPIVDLTQGQHAPNPKCEIAQQGNGFVFRVKSPNGKVVLTCPPMQSKKAVLRAISMIRAALEDAEVLFWHRAGFSSLTVELSEGLPAPRARRTPPLEVTPTPVDEPPFAADLTPPPVDEPPFAADLTPTPVDEPPFAADLTPTPVDEPPFVADLTPTPVDEPPLALDPVPVDVSTPAQPPKNGVTGIFGRIKKVGKTRKS